MNYGRPYGTTIEEIEHIKTLRKEGLPIKIIVRRTGRSHVTVINICKGRQQVTRDDLGRIVNHWNHHKPRKTVDV